MPLSACFEGAEDPVGDAFPDSSPIRERHFRRIEVLAVKLADAAKRRDEKATSDLLARVLRMSRAFAKRGR